MGVKIKLDEAAERAVARLKVGMSVKVKGYETRKAAVLKPDDKPLVGKVIAIVMEVGYPIAVEFPEAVFGGNSCEKRGREGYCRWVMPQYISPL